MVDLAAKYSLFWPGTPFQNSNRKKFLKSLVNTNTGEALLI